MNIIVKNKAKYKIAISIGEPVTDDNGKCIEPGKFTEVECDDIKQLYVFYNHGVLTASVTQWDNNTTVVVFEDRIDDGENKNSINGTSD